MGQEYDDMADWAYTVRQEAFVQTCTWSLPIWEWLYGIEPDDALPIDYRRGRILSKKLQVPPINPARIEQILSALTGVPVEIIENEGPYTFRVVVDESTMPVENLKQMFRLLREIKPSHLSFCTESQSRKYFETEIFIAAQAWQTSRTALPMLSREVEFETTLYAGMQGWVFGSKALPEITDLGSAGLIQVDAAGIEAGWLQLDGGDVQRMRLIIN
jgi:hypothetical protein